MSMSPSICVCSADFAIRASLGAACKCTVAERNFEQNAWNLGLLAIPNNIRTQLPNLSNKLLLENAIAACMHEYARGNAATRRTCGNAATGHAAMPLREMRNATRGNAAIAHAAMPLPYAAMPQE